MTKIESSFDFFSQPEDLLEQANSLAYSLIEKANQQANDLIDKANTQADILLEKANTQAEILIGKAQENETTLLERASLGEKILLSYANSNERELIQQANAVVKELMSRAIAREEILTHNAIELAIGTAIQTAIRNQEVKTQTAESAKELIKKAAVQANDLVSEAGEHARDLVSEADQRAQGLLNKADHHAKDILLEADERAKVLVKKAASEAKNLVREAAFKAKDLVGEAASQTKDLINDAAVKSKELIREAAATYLKNKFTFLNIAAHELRTPLTSISFRVQLAEREIEKGNLLSGIFLKQLRPPLNRLSRLVNDLIDMSKLERKSLVFIPVKTDLSALISDCLDEFRIEIPNISFHFEKPVQKIELFVDPLRIYQVVSNLLDNAVKYSGTESVNVTLRIGHDVVRVEITDYGIGIPEEKRTQLFTSFFRVESDKTAGVRGLGLGLIMSKEIMKLHNGRIGYEHQPESGNTFFFELPSRI